MNNQAASDTDFRTYASSRHGRQQTESSFTIWATVLTVLLCVAFPYFCDTPRNRDRLSRYINALQDMVSRVGMGMMKRSFEGGAGFGGGSALSSVFGLKNNIPLKGLGTDSLRRGIGGIAMSAQSDIPAGLGNWDNSCYQNSVIQGLASLRSLPDFLARVAARIPQHDSTNISLLETVEKLKNVGNNGGKIWLPATLKSMNTWQQQDAQEYFSKILDQLDKEAIKATRQEIVRKYNLNTEEIVEMLADGANMDTERSEATIPLQNPLEGMLAQRVACKKCGHSDGISLIPFNCLTVPLGQETLYDIRDCLDEFTKLEEIDGVQCPKCTLLQVRGKLEGMFEKATSHAVKDQIDQRLQAVIEALDDADFSDNAITKRCQIPKKQWALSTKTKQQVVARAPKAFVVHVNRSIFNERTGAQLKNPAAVQFPLTFCLGDWMLGKLGGLETAKGTAELWSMDPMKTMLPEHGDTFENGTDAASSAQYELRAVVTHFGRHENGHYVAYRRHPHAEVKESDETDSQGESWWRLSDDDVTRVQQDTVLRQGGVFMLFYERIDRVPSELVPSSLATEAAISSLADVLKASQIPLPVNDFESDLDLTENVATAEIPFPDNDLDELVDHTITSSHLPALISAAPFPKQLPTPPESVTESDIEEPSEDLLDHACESGKPQPILMRTSSVFHDDRGSEESLLSPRMVSAL